MIWQHNRLFPTHYSREKNISTIVLEYQRQQIFGLSVDLFIKPNDLTKKENINRISLCYKVRNT